MDAERIIERYRDAMNAHDLDALVDCFDPDYETLQPLNPDRDFRGRETVRERWTAIFRNVPDFGPSSCELPSPRTRYGASGVGWGRA